MHHFIGSAKIAFSLRWCTSAAGWGRYTLSSLLRGRCHQCAENVDLTCLLAWLFCQGWVLIDHVYTAKVVKRWATGLAIGCLLVGQHASNGDNSSFWQLPTQKVKTRWATSTTSSGLAIGHVFDSPSKATDACVASCTII